MFKPKFRVTMVAVMPDHAVVHGQLLTDLPAIPAYGLQIGMSKEQAGGFEPGVTYEMAFKPEPE